jgi:hypothetical protein
MLSRKARYCPMCRGGLEIRTRFVSATPSTDRADRYLWCPACKAGIRIQKIQLEGPYVRTNPRKSTKKAD